MHTNALGDWRGGARGVRQGGWRPAQADPPADLEQAQPQGIGLGAGDVELGQPAPQRVEQPVGRPVQQEAELVGPKPVVARWRVATNSWDDQFGAARNDLRASRHRTGDDDRLEAPLRKAALPAASSSAVVGGEAMPAPTRSQSEPTVSSNGAPKVDGPEDS